MREGVEPRVKGIQSAAVKNPLASGHFTRHALAAKRADESLRKDRAGG